MKAVLSANLSFLEEISSMIALKRSLLLVAAVLAIALASCISDPTWGAPATPNPGSYFNLTVSGKVLQVTITNGTRAYTLEYQNGKVFVPKSVQPGLYDLIVKTDHGECYQHNAVWVVPRSLKSLTVMHLTDEHFGVYNPTGRWARNYVLAAIIIANSDPQVNAIFVTGDVADTAMPYQYQEARLIHGLSTKPVFVIPGNHDHVNPQPTFEEYVGPWHWYRIINDILVVGIDTGADGYIGVAQASFVSKLLAKNYPIKVILHHHPLFAFLYGKPYVFKVDSWEQLFKTMLSKKPGSKYPYIYTSWLADEEGLKELVKAIYDDNLTLSLSGHIHLDSYALVERPNGLKTWFIVTTTAGGPIRQSDYHGFKIVKIAKNDVEVYGLGKPWSRHASYSLEGAIADLGQNNVVSVVTFKLTDKNLTKLLPHLVLAVPIPKNMAGEYNIYSPDFQKVWLRCTPAFCVLFASTNKVMLNHTYRLAVYTKADLKPPTVEGLKYPKNVTVGTPITISFSAYDDAWGIQKVYAIVSSPSYKLKATPMSYGTTYTLNLPPVKKPGTLNVTLVLEDYYGHKTIKHFSVEVLGKTQQAQHVKPKAIPSINVPLLPIAIGALLILAAAALFLLI
ncbi:hypothetical protein IPA_08260 [Ignicoccus pacificus DSM 13166]|uniref:Calcineurin-like phosphoesterase domain-containing protein n=1 Tax=Ignicoccus pacificus DSM 13166 TaxID=940294 RepID=A0A977KBY8_9CREN|nr:hypothetical protein IPA_08260 [Ignicoccus pacificus DSM 13166]